MERAILKTLKYFGYPLKVWEIQKWLIGQKATMSQVEKALNSKKLKNKLWCAGDYYFLKAKKISFKKRVEEETKESLLLRRARILAPFLRFKKGVTLIVLDREGVIDLTEEMSLEVAPRNLENALRVLKLQVLWEKDNTWGKVLEINSWVYRFFPNFVSR
jgi:hypothetical protein